MWGGFSDVDEDAGVAMVWLLRHPGAPDSAEHALQFEREGGWRFLGGAGSSARELPLAGRPSASVHGPSTMMRFLSSSASRSRAGPEQQEAGWVSCASFRLATEVGQLQVAERSIPVPDHGYVIVGWRSPSARARPLIVAVGKDGSRLSELGPDDFLDSLTWESVQRSLPDDPLPG